MRRDLHALLAQETAAAQTHQHPPREESDASLPRTQLTESPWLLPACCWNQTHPGLPLHHQIWSHLPSASSWSWVLSESYCLSRFHFSAPFFGQTSCHGHWNEEKKRRKNEKKEKKKKGNIIMCNYCKCSMLEKDNSWWVKIYIISRVVMSFCSQSQEVSCLSPLTRTLPSSFCSFRRSWLKPLHACTKYQYTTPSCGLHLFT